MIPLNIHLYHSTAIEGPGLFRFDLKECKFGPRFFTYNTNTVSVEKVLDAVKRNGLLNKVAYLGLNGYFGPVNIEHLSADDFKLLDGSYIKQTLDELVDLATASFVDVDYKNGEADLIKIRIGHALEFIPVDFVSFFLYNVPIRKQNTGNLKLEGQNIFDYFYFIFGFNEESFYLITLFYL